MKNTLPALLSSLYMCGKAIPVLYENEPLCRLSLPCLRVREVPGCPGRGGTLEITALTDSRFPQQASWFLLLLSRLPGILKPPVPSCTGGPVRITCTIRACSSRPAHSPG